MPTCSDPSVPSHLKWQVLETSNPLTLFTVDYGPEVVGGEDADGVPQRSGAELSRDLAVPGHSSNI